jgi:predicted TIM-barrel fold metal-dependent hydrolase
MKPLPAYLALLLLVPALAAGCASEAQPPPDAPASVPGQAAIPKIDFHAHYSTTHDTLVPTLARWNMRAVLVSVASSEAFAERWQGMQALHAAAPGRFVLCTTFDPFLFNEPDFVERTLAQLQADRAAGARMVKVWKNIGLELKDGDGQHVQIDHPRFQPIWDYLAAEGIPVLAHIAEPRAAWLPLDEQSPHYHYYREHPEYHAYRHPEMPRWEAIIAARDRWLAQNPDLVVVGAHLGSMSHDVGEVARRLDAYPNFYVETAARMRDLALQPSDTVRAFMMRFQDRILYGTDNNDNTVANDRLDDVLAEHWRYLASPDAFYYGNPDYWGTDTRGLALPADVLEKIYARNAEHVLGL